jgi:hypothetical protein
MGWWYPTQAKKWLEWGTQPFCKVEGGHPPEDSCKFVERETGIEPATNGLGSRYSTIELLPLAATRLF